MYVAFYFPASLHMQLYRCSCIIHCALSAKLIRHIMNADKIIILSTFIPYPESDGQILLVNERMCVCDFFKSMKKCLEQLPKISDMIFMHIIMVCIM